MDPRNVDFQGALSAGAKHTANNQSEQRNVTYDGEWRDGLERWLSSVIGPHICRRLEISVKLSHARPIPVCKPKVQLRERDGKARLVCCSRDSRPV